MPSDLRKGRNLLIPAVLVAAGLAVAAAGAREGDAKSASPIFGVTVPDGYRSWQLIAPALEGEPLNELRAVVGNDIAVRASARGTVSFPDGTVLVKLAWKRVPSPEFEPATVPGRATTVQVMVKDAKRYAATGGWGFGRFVEGKPVDEAQHETCFACHEARVKDRDFVFTRYAP
ncbi:cytochrome P460 family protein [Methylobacterium durans]|uniref:cytochrome P460 family protein n=1 Tax=Methylobacterium durans TaxID=2202825 RepID=UPI002AFF7399|nr:cytochrome P460 family protein [Methylobacterium durans]MEA1831413.1 cytochrome P460 family protein [Methylobacterium durans]